MSDLTPERLAELRALAENATPGPWFYNGYSGVFSSPLTQVYDDLDDPECEVPAHKESCGNGPCPGCPFFEHEHEHGPLVAHVPAHHGDTAIGRHAADGAFIAEARALVPALLDEIERLRADTDRLPALLNELDDERVSHAETLAALAALVEVAAGAVSDEGAHDPGVMRLMRYLAAKHPVQGSGLERWEVGDRVRHRTTKHVGAIVASDLGRIGVHWDNDPDWRHWYEPIDLEHLAEPKPVHDGTTWTVVEGIAYPDDGIDRYSGASPDA
jgi:hypothetical protein